MGRATIRVTLECDNVCLFCAQRGLLARPRRGDELRAELSAARSRSDEVTFVGGEPTLSPNLEEWISVARRLGFTGVGVQTNGRRLAESAYLSSLVEAGLTDVHLSIHGAEAAVHDYHAGRAGAFAAIMAAAAGLRSHRLTVVATTVLTRSNARVLAGLPQLLRNAGIAGWLVTIPRIAGALTPDDDRLSPRFGIALPFALQALALARQAGLPAWIQGAPLCLLGPYAAHALPDEPRDYAEVCGPCPARAGCPGVDAAYRARFLADELVARPAVQAESPSPLARLFVGVGELAPPVAAPPAFVSGQTVAPPQLLTKLGSAAGRVDVNQPE